MYGKILTPPPPEARSCFRKDPEKKQDAAGSVAAARYLVFVKVIVMDIHILTKKVDRGRFNS